MDEIAITYSKPALTSAKTILAWKGITAQAAKAGMITITGAMKYKTLLDRVGEIISFMSNFKASAIGCSKPNGPTRFGPSRICIQPINLRSQRVI